MAKYLTKPCVDIRIKTLQISRKESEGSWQTYAVIIGEAIDEDGVVLEKIHKKVNVGGPGLDDWDATSFEADLTTIAGLVSAKYAQVLSNYTTP